MYELTVQNQELQDKVNSLSESREFYDPETASSSGLSQKCIVEQRGIKSLKGISINSSSFDTSILESEFQDRGMFLFTLSHGSYVVDQRSGDGRLSGQS